MWTSLIWAVAVPFGRRVGWIPRLTRIDLIIALLLLSTRSITARSTAEILAEPIGFDATLRAVLAGIALLIALPMLYQRRQQLGRRQLPGMLALTLYAAVAAASLMYAVVFVASAGKVFQLGAGLAAVWVMALGRDPRRQLDHGIRYIVLLEGSLVAAAVLGYFLLPGVYQVTLGRPGFFLPSVMNAPFSSANGLAATGGLLAAYAVAHLLGPATKGRVRAAWLTVTLIGTAAVILASGRQGVVILAVSLLVLLWFYRRKSFAFILGPLLAALIAVNWTTVVDVFTRGRPEQTVTLTGRVGWWQSALESFWDEPLTGYGFGVGGRFVAQARIGNVSIPGVHNGYIEALVGVGILGVIPLAYALWKAGSWAYREMRDRRPPANPILIVPLVLHTIVSLGFAGWLNSDFLVFGALVGLSDVAVRRVRAGPSPGGRTAVSR
jgi:hypothetical protein